MQIRRRERDSFVELSRNPRGLSCKQQSIIAARFSNMSAIKDHIHECQGVVPIDNYHWTTSTTPRCSHIRSIEHRIAASAHNWTRVFWQQPTSELNDLQTPGDRFSALSSLGSGFASSGTGVHRYLSTVVGTQELMQSDLRALKRQLICRLSSQMRPLAGTTIARFQVTTSFDRISAE